MSNTDSEIIKVNTLVRDASNPSTNDGYFPVSRSFDWYHGHSWAKGLFDSGDGKDQYVFLDFLIPILDLVVSFGSVLSVFYSRDMIQGSLYPL